MAESLKEIGICDINIDDFRLQNKDIFNYQDNYFEHHKVYRLLGMLSGSIAGFGAYCL